MGSPYFPSCLKDEELKKVGASSDGSTEPWDTPFNRATNAYKKRPVDEPPTSAGRVSGFGLNMKVAEYYGSDAKSRKERRKSTKDNAEVQELRAMVESLQKRLDEKAPEDPETVNKIVDERIRQVIPQGLMEGIAAWNAAGRKGPIHLPSYAGSNSSQNQEVSPSLLTPEPPLHTSTPPSAAALDRPAPGTGALVSTPAELDAITKVTN
jgi:hypothetical protein